MSSFHKVVRPHLPKLRRHRAISRVASSCDPPLVALPLPVVPLPLAVLLAVLPLVALPLPVVPLRVALPLAVLSFVLGVVLPV